ncbi:hypothetical protein Ahy_B02g060985 [Arachis hypogaea]|uniref:Protein FAR1-RELATED SEQUENCE n=1 Tax=Arachis hypogaea TaxID=3818 RepID=A0A445AJY7_ARAHY|nr:hypothetical protein Ahy_B02g060985 [Arachis hypogaea]
MTCLDEEIIDHFESSLFSQDEDVRADNDPLAWEDIEGCHVSENYAEEVQGVDCNVDEFFGDTFYDNLDERAVDGINELRYMNLKEITASEVRLLHFWDRTVSFSFYQLYSKMNGFAVRKNKIRRNVKNEVTQQQFVCFREGFRNSGSENDSHRHKRKPKPETRCGCLAEMCVHVHVESGRWITSYFQDEHNHDMLDDRLTFMLPGHRNMNDTAIDQMNLMLKVGIKTPQIYSSRKIWATAYIRGHFFGGFRTTSRCEGLHSMLGKFVHSRHNFRDFIEQFLRCICQMRSREAQSELASVIGDLVLQSPLHALERSAFRPMLSRACTLKVRSCTLTPSCEIYTLSRSGNPNKEWNVSQYRDRSIFKCSCFRMESLGIPCDHIVAVLVHLDAEEIPKSLLIDRWSKNVRSKVWEFMENGPFCWESMRTCRNWTINDMCREICVLDPLVKPNLMS